MKTKQAAALLIGLAMMIIGGCDAVGTNNGSSAEIDLGSAPLYRMSSPSIVVFPLAPDSTGFFTTYQDTSGYE